MAPKSIASIGVDCAAADLTKGAVASALAPNRKERRSRLIMGILSVIHVKARRGSQNVSRHHGVPKNVGSTWPRPAAALRGVGLRPVLQPARVPPPALVCHRLCESVGF